MDPRLNKRLGHIENRISEILEKLDYLLGISKKENN